MRAIGKLPKSVLILEFIGMMLLAVALLSVSDSLSLPEPFSRPEVQILMIFLGVLLMLPAAVVVRVCDPGTARWPGQHHDRARAVAGVL